MSLLGIDLGTSSLKAVLVNEEGEIVALAGKEYGIDTPNPGWAEQDPQVWWEAAKETICQVISESAVNPADIKGIGLSGQMHGTVLLDDNNKPLRPAIIWCDQRSKAQCLEIKEKIGEAGLEQACNPVSTGFMAATLLWIKEKESDIFRRIYKVLLPKDYLILKLTGEISTDISDASATLLFNVRERKWSQDICDAIGVLETVLPTLFDSTEVIGRISSEVSNETGLSVKTPVVAGGGDTPVSALGNGVIEPGSILCTIGTGGILLAPLENPVFDRLFRTNTFCHCLREKWYIMGAMLSGGLSLQWYRDNIGREDYSTLSSDAVKVAPGSDGLLFLPYLIGERTPHMDPDARGAFIGLTIRHTKAHLVRAIMEGVVFGLRDCLEILKELGVKTDRIIASGGAARSPVWRQIQSDILQSELVTTEVEEQTVFGAAMLAGIGTGIYKDAEDACKRLIKYGSVTKPIEKNVEIYEEYYQIYKQLYPGLKSKFSSISQLVRKD